MLKLKNISFSYADQPVLEHLNLTIPTGELVGVIGESGSGKSTLMELILGELEPDEGIIDSNTQRILPIFQQASQSFNPRQRLRTALLEPLKYYANADKSFDQIVLLLMEQLDLDKSLLNRYPDQVSGGQLQRFNVLRTVMLQPDVLICDEITASLDVIAESKLINILKQIHAEQQSTMIIISHDIAVLNQIVDRMMVLNNGTIVDDFKIQDLFSDERNDYTKALIDVYQE
ncbi:ABC transporter ATP-binding protein [Staphylococcus debuckii]|uniref:ABC transporter ATP-binding protein n=1 Tax=Staphylococcus debuckii TaxID=2044912 RepID=UPI000F436AD9|nr:ATP-binding cassette domain-containing protein [Staphylococcus debuckii]AYU55194.1 ATP-binding cassette domain-containing protein [Staphylococcus debuckii]